MNHVLSVDDIVLIHNAPFYVSDVRNENGHIIYDYVGLNTKKTFTDIIAYPLIGRMLPVHKLKNNDEIMDMGTLSHKETKYKLIYKDGGCSLHDACDKLPVKMFNQCLVKNIEIGSEIKGLGICTKKIRAANQDKYILEIEGPSQSVNLYVFDEECSLPIIYKSALVKVPAGA